MSRLGFLEAQPRFRLLQRPRHRDFGLVEIDVLPAKRQQFAAPHTAR
jgi:hypothetical protein